MGLFKRAAVAGMSHYLMREGIVTWPSKEAEAEAVDAVADNFGDEEVPEMTDESGLTAEEAEAVLDQIVEVANALEQKTGGVKNIELNKEAAASNYQQTASQTAVRLMEKAAEETAVATGPDVPGTKAPAPDNTATAEGKIDEANTPSSLLVGEKGKSTVDTKPGAVGKEEPQVQEPGAVGTPATGEVSKLSSMLGALTKSASVIDGASLSGGGTAGPAPAPRKDLDDNLNIIKAVGSGKGKTVQPNPIAANVGYSMRQPAGTPGVTAPTNNEPAKDAIKKAAEALRETPEGRKILFKLAEEAKRAQEEDQGRQEEAVANQLNSIANLFR